MILEMFPEPVLYNIMGHLTASWDNGNLPTGNPLETAVHRGLSAFYPAEKFGDAHTFVDETCVLPDGTTIALDIKGRKVLDARKKRGQFTGQFTTPNRVDIITRRPTTDLQDFHGNPFDILSEQVEDYRQFAINSAKEKNCDEIVCMICLYGEAGPYRQLQLYVEPFEISPLNSANTHVSKNEKRKYVGYDVHGNENYSIKSFSKGSINFYRTIDITTQPFTFDYQCDSSDTYPCYTKEDLYQRYRRNDDYSLFRS